MRRDCKNCDKGDKAARNSYKPQGIYAVRAKEDALFIEETRRALNKFLIDPNN